MQQDLNDPALDFVCVDLMCADCVCDDNISQDLIDPALLRPGRLEVHLEITAPSANGRQEVRKDFV